MELIFWCAPLWLVTFVVLHEDLSKGQWGSAFGFTLAMLFLFVGPPTYVFLRLFLSGLRGPFSTPAVSGGNSSNVPDV
jgi:hypothetical protein